MRKTAEKAVNFIENSKTGFWLWSSSFLCLIILRILIENWLENFQNRSATFLFYEFTHNFLFFIVSYLLFVFFITKILNISIEKFSNVLLWGFLIILTPPIIDHIISGGQGYWSFYEFDGIRGLVGRFFTFYGDTPEIGITYGVRVEVAMAVVFLFIYSLIKSRDLLKGFAVAVFSYAIFFILGTFPSYIAIVIRGFGKGFLSIDDIDVAQMFLTPARIFSREIPDIVSSLNIKMSIVYSLVLILLSVIFCLLLSRKKTLSFFANARYPQILYHIGLALAGMALAAIYTDTGIEANFFNLASFLLVLSSIILAWLASLIPNDIEDMNADALTPNKNRPLVKNIFSLEEYKKIGWTMFALSLFFSAIINIKIALLLLVYHAIAWVYSCPPLKLKRIAFISTFVSSLALLMIFFSGYILISPDQSIRTVPTSVISLFIFGCVFILPIKDFKDITGDKKEGNYTVPVLLGEKWGKIVVGTGAFLAFILSVVVFNEPRLFWWAILSGAASYWIILSSGESDRIKYHRLPWWIMSIVLLYGIALVVVYFTS